MHRTDKYSQHSSVIWPVRLNGWMFVFELSGCGFKSSCSHVNCRTSVTWVLTKFWMSLEQVMDECRTSDSKCMFNSWHKLVTTISHLAYLGW